MRRLNAAVSRLSSWLERGYSFNSDMTSEVLGHMSLAFILMTTPAQPNDLGPDGPVVLWETEKAFEIISGKAAAIDGQAIDVSGVPLTFNELELRLERYRLSDCRAGRNDLSGAYALHSLMRPPSPDCHLGQNLSVFGKSGS